MKRKTHIPAGSEIEALIVGELSIHPACHLVDIYKLILQSYFGTAHMLADIETVSQNICNEALTMQHPYQPLIQHLGSSSFCRVSLSILHEAMLHDVPHFRQQCTNMAEQMQLSCITTNPTYTIADIWQSSKKLIIEIYPSATSDWDLVNQFAEKGIIPSHSDNFRQAYDPHYRVLNPHINDFVMSFNKEHK